MRPAGGLLYLHRVTGKMGEASVFNSILEEGATASPELPKPVQTELWLKAADFWGNGALYAGQTDYAYGALAAGGALRPVKPVVQATDSEDSVLQEGQKVFTRSSYDELTGRLKSIIRSGYSEMFDSHTGLWSGSTLRHVGIFYFNHHKCSGELDTGGSEVLEVHGPCAVSGPLAIDCDQGNDFPITQYAYYPAPSIERSNRANRLKKISRFIHHDGPNACSGHPALETTYDNYDARGNVVSITDPRGVQAVFQYTGGRVTDVTTAGLTLRFTYEGANLTAIRFPAGNHAVRCYRSGTTSGQGCTGGQRTAQLQWIAMAADASGADWSEQTVFTYWPDGALKAEEYRSRRDGVEETRRKVEYHPDAHWRPTHARWGVGPGSFAAVGAFNKNSNRKGIGLPFNEAPDFCAIDSTGQPLSQLCVALGYDRADRLTHMAEFPTPAVEQHTTFTYDGHGHVDSIQTGCASAAGCEQPFSSYRYDDFGNLLQVRFPQATGPVRYGYDARGNATVKQTETMRQAGGWLEYNYDVLSRPRGAARVSIGSTPRREELFRLGYDDTGAVPTGCERDAQDVVDLKSWGLLRFREDSFGSTWYRYDTAGRLVGEVRVRQGETTCRKELETRYDYDARGRLEGLRYPHQRSISYVYGIGAYAHRVSAIEVLMFTGTSTNERRRLVSHVIWEPFGSLRGYQVNPSQGGAFAVEYALGDDGSAEPGDCSKAFPSKAASDLTGRLRSLRVSQGPFTPGVGSGDIYHRTYTWKADQVARIDSCLLGATTPQTETYTYDRTLRLTNAGRTAAHVATTSGAFSSHVYGYDQRGNRMTLLENGFESALVHGTGNHLDQLLSMNSQTDALLSSTYVYDADGRSIQKEQGAYSTGERARTIVLSYGTPLAEGQSGSERETVFRTVRVNGLTYSYYYDALGRRRAKIYPSGVRDEFFHSASHELLVDQGSNSVLSTSFRTVDDYVWLDGRPVVLLRGKLEPSLDVRLSDSSLDCQRNGEAAACGAWFPVTDHVGKPVLMLDSAGRVAGAADYEPFGHVNRVAHHAGTKHPYANSQSSVLATFSQRPESKLRVRMRVLFQLVDTKQASDVVELVDPDTGSTLGSTTGYRLGRVVTPWVEPTAGRLSVRFTLGQTLPGTDTHTGVVVEGYEYQRFQDGAMPFWIPLRSPGQYYDAETDFFENWNRYYDPSIGRYLQPEPMLQDPEFVKWRALQGLGSPTYAYASSNPINRVDRNGLWDTGVGDILAYNQMTPEQQADVDTAQRIVGATYAVVFVGRYALPAAGGALKKVWNNIDIDGPSGGLCHANGRIVGVRWKKSQWGARLDLHPLPGSGGRPILHINHGPLGRGEAQHIELWDPVKWWTDP